MVTSVSLKNFKSFEAAEANDLRLVNMIVGDNGSGKTALLEGIFLASGVTPELLLRTRNWRGWGDGLTFTGSREEMERSLWGDLFYKFQMNKPASVEMRGSGEENRAVSISYKKPGAKTVIPPDRRQRQKAPVAVPDPDRIRFRWEIKGRPPLTVTGQLTKDGIVFTPQSESFVRGAFISSLRPPSANETTNRFSRLSQTFEAEAFEDAFRKHYPNVSDLSININAGVPLIYARVEGLPEKIPLVAASGGISKLAYILLCIADQPDGFVIVDEVDNGIYYERLPSILGTLHSFAKLYNCQLFLSTHSNECLKAAASVASESPEDFALLRTVADKGRTVIRCFDGKDFAEAVASHVEVR